MSYNARANAILFSAATMFALTAFAGAQAPPAPAAPAAPRAQGAAGPPPGGRGAGGPGTESGWATFQAQCFGCHTNTPAKAKTTAWQIRQMTPERIVAGLNAPTHTVGRELSDIQKQRIGEFMSGRPLGSVNNGDAAAMPNRCTTNPQMANPAGSPSWNGWSTDLANTRFQPAAAARLTAADVPRLTLKWAFGIPYGMTNNAQPRRAGSAYSRGQGSSRSMPARWRGRASACWRCTGSASPWPRRCSRCPSAGRP